MKYRDGEERKEGRRREREREGEKERETDRQNKEMQTRTGGKTKKITLEDTDIIRIYIREKYSQLTNILKHCRIRKKAKTTIKLSVYLCNFCCTTILSTQK